MRAPRPSRRRAGWRCTSPACRPRGQDLREERKGPRVGAPEAAVQGFLQERRPRLDRPGARSSADPKKGEFYVAVIERPGRATLEVLAEILPGIIRELPLAEIDALGRASAQPGSLRWVRPLHSILCTFGPETEEPEIVPFEVDGIAAGNVTYGHRFLAPDADHGAPLRRLRAERWSAPRSCSTPTAASDIILHDARDLAFAQGLELVEDEGLLEEVAGPGRMAGGADGHFDESFLDIPAEVIRATIRANQKCFVLRRAGERDARQPLHPASPTSRRATAARRSWPATSAWCAPGCPTRKFFWETDLKAMPPAKTGCDEARQHRVPREARHAGRARRAHRGAGARAGAARRRRSRTWPSAPRGSPRPTSSPRWSASSPSCRA